MITVEIKWKLTKDLQKNKTYMVLASKILIGLIAFLHFYILYIEMFAWTTKGKKVFKELPSDLFEKTIAMAANQGLYNGFLAAGLTWTFFISNAEWATNIAIFFLACIAVSGFYGAISVTKKTIFIQTIPATIAIALLLL